MEAQTEANLGVNESVAPEVEKPTQAESQANEPKKYTLKIGENNEELTEDKLVELVKAGRDSSQTQAQYEQTLKMLKEDPRKFLSDPSLGIDLYKLAEETLLEKIQHDMLSPEQKKIREYEQKVKEYEEREKAEKLKREQEELSRAEAHWMQEYERLFQEALASSELPKTPRTIKRMAELASIELNSGKELDAKTLASMIKTEYLNELKELLGGYEEDRLLQVLGDEISNKIRKADLKRLKGTAPAPVTGNQTIRRTGPNRIDKMQWRDQIDRIKQGLE